MSAPLSLFSLFLLSFFSATLCCISLNKVRMKINLNPSDGTVPVRVWQLTVKNCQEKFINNMSCVWKGKGLFWIKKRRRTWCVFAKDSRKDKYGIHKRGSRWSTCMLCESEWEKRNVKLCSEGFQSLNLEFWNPLEAIWGKYYSKKQKEKQFWCEGGK